MASPAKKTVELFYDVVSPYSWIAFEVLCRYQSKWAMNLKLKPFFLGGVMHESGNQPPGMVAAKAVYMVKDLDRLAKHYRIPLNPLLEEYAETIIIKGSLQAQRLLTAMDMTHPELTEALSRALWTRIWSKDVDITTHESFIQAGKSIGLDDKIMKECLEKISDQAVKARLKEYTAEALEYGAFGAPIIIAPDKQGEKQMIFGCDRFHVLADVLGERYEGPCIELASKL